VTSRVAIVLVLVTVFATACTRTSSPIAKTTPSPSPAEQLIWADCGNGFQCATVHVPLDYANPTSGTIGIAINRKPATDQANRIGSLLINPGGPGASGLTFVRGFAPALTNLNQRFDLIGFDPRGVGQSAPVRCLDATHEDAFNALDGVLDDPQEKQAGIDADKAYAAGCLQLSPQTLGFVGTVSAAKDMDVIRADLGDSKLTYLGFSYGTYLGENYAHLFPTKIRALALDGVVDPAVQPNDLVYEQIVGFERNLQAFLSDCRARKTSTRSCGYAQGADPGTKLPALMQRLDVTPMPVGTRTLTRALAVIGVLQALYNPASWPALDQALTLADSGNGAALLRSSDQYLGRNANGTYTNSLDASSAINCIDKPAPTDIAAYDALGPKFASASAVFGPNFQYSNLPCAYWPVKPTGKVEPITTTATVPILLVGGTNDPATPYAWAQSVNKMLAGSILLTRQGDGHVSYTKSACARQVIDAYLIDLALPAQGTVCQ
jgi:pimeloyl-ACP methyl ester carboxylesterase